MTSVYPYKRMKPTKCMAYTRNSDFSEFCGIVFGDGNIWTNGRRYEITITGSPKDKGYMDCIAEYVVQTIKPKVYYRIRGRGLRLTIYSKKLFNFLVGIGMKSGAEKGKLGIPKKICESRDLY